MTTATKKNTTAAAEILKEVGGPIPPKAVHGTLAVTPDYLTPNRPDDSDLDTLGRHAKAAAKAGAEKAWELGRACVLAKNQTTKKEYGEWCKTWIPDIGDRTRQRYEKVGILDFDTVKGKTKDDVYRILFGAHYATGKGKDITAPVRKKLDALPDDALLEVAMKYEIDADAVELRAFMGDVLDAVK